MRWLKFNAVGVGGAAVQLCALWMLHRFTSLSYVFAIVVAVEIAILHNFAWHEAWTWPGKPVSERWRRLVRFHASNGLVSILSNVALTYLFKEAAGLPLVAANFAAIVTAALLNFWVAQAWVFRGLVVVLLCSASGAVITTTLQPQTGAAWDKYIDAFERGPVRPPLPVKGDKPSLMDLNVNGEVPDGFIHHWIGAELIPNTTVERVEGILEDYDRYPQVYAPDLKLAEAKRTGTRSFDVRLITERIEGLGLHFAFDMHSRVEYRREHGDSLVESRSYLIRESNSGHAPYKDLMPAGNDHGILWRLNSYWRLRQEGPAVYAECQAISLSRRPLFGTMGQVKNRARDSLGFTLRQTRKAAGGR